MKKVFVLVFIFTLLFSLTAYAVEGDKIVSSDEEYVGKGVVLEEGQMGITSVEAVSSNTNNSTILFISALAIGIAVIMTTILYRKLKLKAVKV